MRSSRRVHVIDSHTGGEPTRVALIGGPDLGAGPLSERLQRFRDHHDHFRSAIVNEPRGSDVLVGALMVEPVDSTCVAGVIFFNNVGYLGMCGHGMIGVIITLAHLGRVTRGLNRIETPVGVITAELHPDRLVSIKNVPSFRTAKNVELDVPEFGRVAGDVAWGGNWFFLIEKHPFDLRLDAVADLTRFTAAVRRAANAQGFPDVDHVELIGPPIRSGANARNFVLCPGNAYDRSPCGTGTSAKVACLAADGKLQEGDEWVQESITGSTFSARFRWEDREQGRIIPTVTGSAFITSESTLVLESNDPLCWGIR